MYVVMLQNNTEKYKPKYKPKRDIELEWKN